MADTVFLADLAGILSDSFGRISARLRHAEASDTSAPSVGSAESMLVVLSKFADTKPGHGLSQREASEVARSAGMDPRGLAGYFAAGLLGLDAANDSRWITDAGRERLNRLQAQLLI